jgi:hypothetical protein
MRRDRTLKVVLVVVGLLFTAGVVPLTMFFSRVGETGSAKRTSAPPPIATGPVRCRVRYCALQEKAIAAAGGPQMVIVAVFVGAGGT